MEIILFILLIFFILIFFGIYRVYYGNNNENEKDLIYD